MAFIQGPPLIKCLLKGTYIYYLFIEKYTQI